MTISDGVADVRMNRADKRNALDGAMFQALAEVGRTAEDRAGVRVVVLSGEGSSFCAGLDFSSFQIDGRWRTASDRPTRQSRRRCRTAASPISASRCAGCGRRSRCR